MESHSENEHGPTAAREALEALSSDRGRIGDRVTAETFWAAPSQGLGAAFIIGAPAAGLAGAWWPIILGLGIFIGVELLFRQRSGLSITLPAGPRGIWLLVALTVIVTGSFVTSIIFALFGLTGWVIAVAAVAGVMTTFIVMAYDRTFAAEVRLAG
ncbi:hypothetical protein [Salinibacterium sp. PAMC 21357]|uniref:hypothetical protein n=1 Tax=Salinibacterium sp. PAMC 21357 TaxID=1112215 RepID=UPI000287A65D|nr:hypothetical protein [Salinibacterium sp. PAMC 21357]